MCLDLSAAASNGVRVIHLPCASTRSTQRWAKAKPRAKSFALVNQSSGAHYCLDVVDKNPLGGALLQTWGCSWAWNQYWFFG